MRSLLLTAAIFAALPIFAQEAASDNDAKLEKFMSSLHYQTGDVRLPQAKAVIHASADYPLLNASDAQKVLEELWGNPPDADVLGMIVPKKAGLMGDGAWAVVLTYANEGYVSDKEAASTDYDAMLKDLQAGTRENNAERKKQGYPSIELHGWAARPHYDSSSAKLYWAKDFTFDGSESHTLNYDVRALGRSGYLSMNAVAEMKDLAAVQTDMNDVIKMVEFEPGARYADFDASTDKTAAYGLAALVAGGLAAKTGLLAKLLAILIAGKKLLVLVVAGLYAGVKKLLSGKSGGAQPPPPPR
jgi:uncharacterized membrane-anchored protein